MAFAECVTVFAAPKYMSDGSVFDPEYYAISNPDVVNVFGLSEEGLWKHYRNWGRKEKRWAYDEVAYQVLLAQLSNAQAVAAAANEGIADQQTATSETPAQSVPQQTNSVAAGININDVDAVITAIGAAATQKGFSPYDVMVVPENAATIDAAEFIMIKFATSDMQNGFYIAYGPKGNVSGLVSDGNTLPPFRLAVLKQGFYITCNSVEEVIAQMK